MKPLKLKEIVNAIGAEYEGIIPDIDITDISTDSRDVKAGSLFVALMGERFDGHEFVDVALNKGALYAVVQKNDCSIDNGRLLKVNSTRQAFLDIAGLYRSKFNIPSVAVTGSVGKTTTREMTYAVMNSAYKTLKTQNNLNNEVGVPKTLLSLDESYEALLLEFGMQAMGEIRELTKPARPNIGIITSIGVAHIEQLGSRENILKTKMEIIEGMPKGSTLIINSDNDMLKGVKCEGLNVLSYGIKDERAQTRAININEHDNETTFDILWQGEAYSATIPIVGEHNVMNALAGFTAGVTLNIAPQQCADALYNFKQTGMRQHVINVRGVTVVEDCYNANPDSMAAALSTLSQWKINKGAKRIAVLGDMLELGDYSQKAHRDIGKLAAKTADILFCTGNEAEYIAQGAKEENMPEVYYEKDKEELANKLLKMVKEGDVLWLKASRGMKFEEILDLFCEK